MGTTPVLMIEKMHGVLCVRYSVYLRPFFESDKVAVISGWFE